MTLRKRSPNKPYYSIRQIRNFVASGKYIITEDARSKAKECFAWGPSDIKKALLKLQAIHFYKSKEHWNNPSIYVDYYKAHGLMDENVYTHFHVDDDKLIINSFHEI